MQKEQLEVFTAAKISMDAYRKKYKESKQEKKACFENLNKNYLPGSPMFVTERDRIQAGYAEKIENARDECLKFFEDALAKTTADVKTAAMVPSKGSLHVLESLKLLENVPISVDEYDVISKEIGGKLYWADRFLEKLADKNGIAKAGIQPSLTVKLAVLEELAQNTRAFLSEFDGEKKNFLVTSSDKYIFGLEERFTGGYAGIYLDNRAQAERMVTKALNKGDSMERACVLSNMLRTVEPDLQTEMLSVLAESQSPALSDPAMKLTNVQKTVDQFRKEESKLMKEADVAMERISRTKSRQDLLGTIFDHLDNRHFVRAIEKKITETNDKELKKSYDHMRELRQEESQKAVEVQ